MLILSIFYKKNTHFLIEIFQGLLLTADNNCNVFIDLKTQKLYIKKKLLSCVLLFIGCTRNHF